MFVARKYYVLTVYVISINADFETTESFTDCTKQDVTLLFL